MTKNLCIDRQTNETFDKQDELRINRLHLDKRRFPTRFRSVTEAMNIDVSSRDIVRALSSSTRFCYFAFVYLKTKPNTPFFFQSTLFYQRERTEKKTSARNDTKQRKKICFSSFSREGRQQSRIKTRRKTIQISSQSYIFVSSDIDEFCNGIGNSRRKT